MKSQPRHFQRNRGSGTTRSRHRIQALMKQVPHLSQPSQWDCGLTCVSMVLKSLAKYAHSDPLDLRLFVHRDAVAQGSVWTIDLAYIFKAFGLCDFTYYTTHVGINFNYASTSYYKSTFQTDSRRIHSLFADAQDNGVRVVPLLLPLDDIKRFLMSGRYAVLMLINLNAIKCRVCARREDAILRAEQARMIEHLNIPWYKRLISKKIRRPIDFEAQNHDPILDETSENPFVWDAGVDSYLFENEDAFREYPDSGISMANARLFKGKRKQNHPQGEQQAPLQQKNKQNVLETEFLPPSSYHDPRLPVDRREFTEQTPLLFYDSDAEEANISQQPMTARQRIYQSKKPQSFAAESNNITLYNVLKTIGSFVFQSNDTENEDSEFKSASASVNTTPSMTARYEAAIAQHDFSTLDAETAWVDPPVFQKQSVSEKQSKRSAPPGVGVISTVYEIDANNIQQLATAPLPESSVPSSSSLSVSAKPRSFSTNTQSPRRTAQSSLTPFQQSFQRQSHTGTSSPPLPQFKFPDLIIHPPPPPPPSPIPISQFLIPSFLQPTTRSPQKHRSFSIPGTDSEKAAAAAAAAAAATAATTGQSSASGSVAGAGSSNTGSASFSPVPPSINNSTAASQKTRKEVSFGAARMGSATTRRDEIFARIGSTRSTTNTADSSDPNHEPEEQQLRRGSLSFWDLRQRLLAQDGVVAAAVDYSQHSESTESQGCSVSLDENISNNIDNDSDSDDDDEDAGYDTDDESDYYSCTSSENDRQTYTGPKHGTSRSCFRCIARRDSADSDGGSSINTNSTTCMSSLTRILLCGKPKSKTVNLPQIEFEGHYVLFIGYDAKSDGFVYRDPGTEEDVCVMDGNALEFARSGVVGSDHDVIVVRAGL
ncbi:guanylyl cyclase domain-containing protein 1 [Physocladia obscura]|uniref:Guanylyl cyclase domain-containing protein 1 n=1 Tax=Physocladia obscura TaxID=109957 RepID=A0AAD5T3D9_9FUNG|nr:guanylyl cyclase domain-containing protein 1 [Physocladia obscura]